MTDSNGAAPIETPAPRAILTIRLEQDGRVNVSYPTDVILADGLLAAARRAIDAHLAQQAAAQQPRIVGANPALLKRLHG